MIKPNCKKIIRFENSELLCEFDQIVGKSYNLENVDWTEL